MNKRTQKPNKQNRTKCLLGIMCFFQYVRYGIRWVTDLHSKVMRSSCYFSMLAQCFCISAIWAKQLQSVMILWLHVLLQQVKSGSGPKSSQQLSVDLKWSSSMVEQMWPSLLSHSKVLLKKKKKKKKNKGASQRHCVSLSMFAPTQSFD